MQELRCRPMKRRLLSALVVTLAVAVPTPHAHADAPPCRYTISSETVLDHDTGLTWQRGVDAATYIQSNATLYCARLPLAGGGWRLPSIHELQTIVDEARNGPAIDSTAFPNTPTAYFWSSSVYAGASSVAWKVNFGGGQVGTDGKSTFLRVRCVR